METESSLNRRLAAALELSSERFELFQETVFGSGASCDPSSVKSQVFGRNLKTIRYAAIIVILTGFYWLLMDILRGGEMALTSGPALAAIILEVLASCYMLILPRLVKNHACKTVQYSFLAYYILIIIGVTVLAATKNVQMLAAGTNHALAGVPLSTCVLFILAMAPLPSKRDSLILGAVLAIMLFVPAFLPGRELYSLMQQSIIRICLVFAYCYIRNVNMALANSIHRLSVLSFTDPLTNILNRRALDAYWASICTGKKAAAIGILFFDIDDFKKYNDLYSHAKGNDVLISVCHAALSALEDDTSFLFRYGGEEFIVLLLDYSDEEIIRCGLRVNEAVQNASIFRDDGSGFDNITVTVGCAREPVGRADCKDYIIRADEQLYIGKSAGKNCVVFDKKIYRP